MASTRPARRVSTPEEVESYSAALEKYRETVGLTPPPTQFVARSSMTAPALDVLVLTFNCGKEAVDAKVFARHLRSALSYDVEHVESHEGEPEQEQHGYMGKERRGVLPDLVVL